MSGSIDCVGVNHMNLVLQDFDASVAHFKNLYGADFLADIPQQELHACLIDIGRVIFELFIPHAFLPVARYGAHFVGLEYEANMEQVRAVVAARGMRIIRDIGLALHTHPADGFGVAFEFYDGSFHARDWPLLGRKMRPASYWRDEHPLGLTGLLGYSVAVDDLDAATRFFQSFLGAEIAYEAARPDIAARAIGLRLAGSAVEVLAPEGEGELRRHLHRHGQGIRSTQFGVRDLAQARRYLADHGITPAIGSLPNSLAIPADQNLGVLFELAQL